MDSGPKEKEILNFQINRLIKNLIRQSLNIIADLREDNEIMLDKFHDLLPDEHKDKVELLNYFSDNKFGYIRKKILDLSNDYLREFERTQEQYDVQFKK